MSNTVPMPDRVTKTESAAELVANNETRRPLLIKRSISEVEVLAPTLVRSPRDDVQIIDCTLLVADIPVDKFLLVDKYAEATAEELVATTLADKLRTDAEDTAGVEVELIPAMFAVSLLCWVAITGCVEL